MKVAKERQDGVVVLTLKGEFDSFVTKAFTSEIDGCLEDGGDGIVLNLMRVKFINSTALGAMIRARKNCKEQDGDLVISQPSNAVKEAMESLGLDRLFSIYPNDEAAVTALAGGTADES